MPYKDPEKQREYYAKWRKENLASRVDSVRWAKIKANFGLTQEDWRAMLAAQGGQCAICPRTESDGRGQFHVDHDHDCCPESGKSCGECVRGLLCSSCNRGLGMFGDNADTLVAAVAYLRRTPI